MSYGYLYKKLNNAEPEDLSTTDLQRPREFRYKAGARYAAVLLLLGSIVAASLVVWSQRTSRNCFKEDIFDNQVTYGLNHSFASISHEYDPFWLDWIDGTKYAIEIPEKEDTGMIPATISM